MYELLEKVNSPEDLKKLGYSSLTAYCEELRDYIDAVVRTNGGHLASSLGAVELAVAIHYVFDCPKDKVLWDVGHQAYAHKIITGRREAFRTIRQSGGISGFPRMTESEYDAFTMGHSSTSLSVGLGYARARDLLKESYDVISVIGDGALTGGMAFEALNDIGASHTPMIIVLNDNKMSISKNVGAMSAYLSKLRISKRYSGFKRSVKKGLIGLPLIGPHLYKSLDRTKDGIKALLQNDKMFEQMGIKYYGPIDGHDLLNLIEMFKQVRHETRPVIIHIITEKGKGNPLIESDPSRFHGVLPVGINDAPSFGGIVSDFLCVEAEHNDRIVAITAAMADGTGLTKFAEKFPSRCFDVGIAEQHAVTLAAGLSAGGLKPYFAVYSTFLQRGFDQILHDVCLNNLNVTFLIDRAGAAGADGVTHQGIYDLAYLSIIPNITVLCPSSGDELKKMLEFSLNFSGPLAIRYPKAYEDLSDSGEFVLGKWKVLSGEKSNVHALCVGSRAIKAASKVENICIVNCNCVKPLDFEYLDSINKSGNIIVTIEDGAKRGGFGEAVLKYLSDNGLKAKVGNIGYNDEFLEDFSVSDSLTNAGITESGIIDMIKKLS